MSYQDWCERIYDLAKRFIAPKLQYSQTTYGEFLDKYVRPGTAWLDLGCGHQVLPPWRQDQERTLVQRGGKVVGLDCDLPSLVKDSCIKLKGCADISSLPLQDSSFDLVTANMVVEHLGDPAEQFSEIHRVLKPGGVFLFHTPNFFGYTTTLARMIPEFLKKKIVYVLERRVSEDVFPTFYRANSREKIKDVAKQSGLEVAELHHIPTEAAFLRIPPLAILELFWIRLLMTSKAERYRTNLIVALKRP